MSSSDQPPINYAKALGFDSVVAAAIFVVCFVPLFGLFAFRSLRNRTEVNTMLTIFCAIRTGAYGIRAVFANSESAGENFNLLITDEVLFAVGFFGLLLSAYSVVLELGVLARHPPPTNPIIRLTQNRRVFRLFMTIAVVLGVVAITKSGSGGAPSASDASTTKTLRYASTVIFLVLTILQVFQTLYFAGKEYSGPGKYRRGPNASFGRRHGILLLVLISILLLVREAYAAITLNKPAGQEDERFWYPLTAAPELLAVLIFSIPGLAPSKNEIAESTEEAPAYEGLQMPAIQRA